MSKARRKARFHHKIRWRLVTRIMARDGLACTICAGPLDRHVKDPGHDRYITFDHILPISRGGTDAPSNLRLAHRACNQARGNDPILPEDEG